jgi:ADP-ribose pyrophosphatase
MPYKRETEMELQEKILDEKILYENRSYKFCSAEVELPNGQKVQREMVKHPGGVAILAFDNEDRCIMVEQYRFVIRETTWEIPAGKLDKIPGETPEQGARRELEEETGLIAGEWIYLGKIYPSPGIIDEVLHLFMARKLHNSRQSLDDDEFINIHHISLTELKTRLASGSINDCKTMSALLLAGFQGHI